MNGGILFAGALALFASLGSLAAAQERTKEATPPPAGMAVATFAGGCFWCMEPPFDKLDGVASTISGYTGGQVKGATYKEVSNGGTGHTEAVQIVYDPKKVRYETLLETFWRNIDPFDAHGQFCDKGDQYRPAIFAHDDEQARLAEASRAGIQARFKQPLVVKIEKAAPFYVAEDYHQNYYQDNPIRYRFYRSSCGRDARLSEIWGAEAGKAPGS
jgi:peptide-methionine (S)-S-oxide reductase